MKENPTFGRVRRFLDTHRQWPLLLAAMLLGLALLIGRGESRTASTPTPDELDVLLFYKVTLEKEITSLCESVSGVSSAEVVVTLEEGSTRRIAYGSDGKAVIVGSGSSAAAEVLSVSPPRVAGVGVVCRGGGDPHVQRELTDLISTALGISAHRVYVSGK